MKGISKTALVVLAIFAGTFVSWDSVAQSGQSEEELASKAPYLSS